MHKLLLVMLTAAVAVGTGYAEWIELTPGLDRAKVTILEQSATGTTYEVTVPGVKLTSENVDGEEFTRIHVPGAAVARLHVGGPELPAIPVRLAVPNGAGLRLEVLDVTTETLQVGSIYPEQVRVPISSPPPTFAIDRGFLSQQGIFPSGQVELKREATWGNLHVADLQVYPVRALPTLQSVEAAASIRIRVSYSGGSYPQRAPTWRWNTYARTIDNFSALDVRTTDDDPAAIKLLVISDYTLDDELEDLLAWTEQRGYRYHVIASGRDTFTELDSAQIKDSILTYYGSGESHDLRWVLLVGNEDDIPLCAVTLGNMTVVGDYWYSDLTPGYPDSIDYYPDIGLARLSADNGTDLENQAQKILTYQTDPIDSPSWLEKMTLVAGLAQPEYYPDSTMFYVMDTMELDYFDWDRDTVMGRTSNNAGLAEAINAGTGALVYFGHGGYDRWVEWCGTSWTYEDVEALINESLPGFVSQFACRSGAIHADNCISEEWMRHPGGAVASLGYTDLYYSDGDGVLGLAHALGGDTSFIRNQTTYAAPVFDIASVAVFTMVYEGCQLNKVAQLLLGDPSMPVWTGGTPAVADVRLPSMIPAFESDCTLACTVYVGAERPVEGALICAWRKGDFEFYITGTTDADGAVALTIPNTGSYGAEVLVTVSEGHAYSSPHTPILPRVDTLLTGQGSWTEMAQMPDRPSGKAVKLGGWLAYNDGDGLIYAAKGYKTMDFYGYDPSADDWTTLTGMPYYQHPVWCNKPPRKGARGICDSDSTILVTQGNNSLGFWCYWIDRDSWSILEDVPAGVSGKKVKGGTDMVFVAQDDTPYVYLLKGYRCEFYRFNTVAKSWQALEDAPIGSRNKWDKGSWLAFDGDNTIYAHKAKYHELWKYDIDSMAWLTTSQLAGMPFIGAAGRRKRSKDGGSTTWYDGRICALKGGNTGEFWRYDPATDVWVELDTLPTFGSTGKRKKVKHGGDIVNADGVLYALKGNKTREFWRYIPGGEGWAVDNHATRQPGRGGSSYGEDPVAEGFEASNPRWSNDGQWVTYSREDENGDMQVYLVNYQQETETQLTDEPGDCEYPVFSNDGWIAFQYLREDEDCYQIAKVSTSAWDGGFSGLTDDAEAAPDADDGQLGSVRSDLADNEVSGLGTPTRLSPAHPLFQPSFMAARPKIESATPADAASESGTRIVPHRALGQSGRSVLRAGLDNMVTVLTDADDDCEHPEWSPDGQRLVYECADTNGYIQIRRIKADGTEEEALTDAEADHEWPAYISENEIVYQK